MNRQRAQYYNYYLNNNKYYLNITARIYKNNIYINIFKFNFYRGNQVYGLDKEYIYKYNKKSYKYYILKALKNINLKSPDKLKLIDINLWVYLPEYIDE